MSCDRTGDPLKLKVDAPPLSYSLQIFESRRKLLYNLKLQNFCCAKLGLNCANAPDFNFTTPQTKSPNRIPENTSLRIGGSRKPKSTLW